MKESKTVGRFLPWKSVEILLMVSTQVLNALQSTVLQTLGKKWGLPTKGSTPPPEVGQKFEGNSTLLKAGAVDLAVISEAYPL